MISPSANTSINITDMYMSVLASLSVDNRLDLIAKLSDSIKKDEDKNTSMTDLRTVFCGQWSDLPLRDESYHGREIMSW